MASAKSTAARRSPMYFGGLLLGLAAMAGLFMAKRAMMPKFHPVTDARPDVTLAPGASVKLAFAEEQPGYFLAAGFPTSATLYKKGADGNYAAVTGLQYNELTAGQYATLGPLAEEGAYSVAADLYICYQPGVADCARLELTQNITVDRAASVSEDRLDINLTQLAQDGLNAGDSENARNKVTPEAKPEAAKE